LRYKCCCIGTFANHVTQKRFSTQSTFVSKGVVITIIEYLGCFSALIIGLSLGMIVGGGSILTISVLVCMFGVSPLPGSAHSLFVGGTLIDFGQRYAGGCIPGHAISGLSNLQLPSLEFKKCLNFKVSYMESLD
jgi:hypothetical protein